MARVGRVDDLAEILLDRDDPATLESAARELHGLLIGMSGGALAASPDTILRDGMAIAPASAASCLLDAARTATFLRGTRLALLAALERCSARPLEVVYAGCGPFAPFALLLAQRFSCHDVQFTLLDAHAESLASARRLSAALDRDGFISGYVRCDAACYTHARPPIHVVVAETMQRALQKEPQVAVALKLVPQLAAGGILVPQSVTVDAALYDQRQGLDASSVIVPLGRLIELSAPTADELAHSVETDVAGARSLGAGSLPIPAGVDPELRLMLRTKVHVFGPAALDDGSSGLTYPVHLHELGSCAAARGVSYRYRLGSNPGFEVRWT